VYSNCLNKFDHWIHYRDDLKRIGYTYRIIKSLTWIIQITLEILAQQVICAHGNIEFLRDQVIYFQI